MQHNHTIFFWIPRIFGIIFILFLGVFALDSFGGQNSFWTQTGAFIMHLFPNFLLLAILFIAWRNERLGGVLFVLSGFLFTFFFATYNHMVTFLLISAPIFLIGALFLLDFYQKQNASLLSHDKIKRRVA